MILSRRNLMRLNVLLGVAVIGMVFMLGSSMGARGAAQDPWGASPVGSGGLAAMTIAAQRAVAVTPSNTTDLALVARAIYSHDGGNVACRFADATSAVFLFAAGEIKPIRCARILSTGTDSTAITALY
jgi:hypothetical protein